jgi:hypothetical protein
MHDTTLAYSALSLSRVVLMCLVVIRPVERSEM